MQLTLGETLYRLRIERGIESKQICEGLCDEATLSRARNDARAMDSLLFESIIGRMGASFEEFTLMVSESEYAYRQWQEDVYVAIEDTKWDDLRHLLDFDIKGKAWINEKIQKQFYHYAKGIYIGSQMRYAEAFGELRSAGEYTIQKQNLHVKTTYLNTMELHILMLSLFYGVKGKVIDVASAKVRFDNLASFIFDGLLDINEKAKVYPKLVCIGLHCLGDRMSEVERLSLCEKAVNLLRQNKTFHDITELLRLYIPMLERSNSKEIGFYKKQYEVFCDLLQSENIDIDFRPEVLGVRKPKIYLTHEYLSSKRHEKGLTQESLSEGICEPETYSRVERGKRAPSRKNFKALAERLDISWALYRGEIVSDNFKAYELRRLQRRAAIEGRWKESLALTRELETCLDMSIVENYQYVKCHEYVMCCRLGEMHIEEACAKLRDLLSLTQKMDIDIFKLVYYSQIEMEIAAHLAQLHRERSKYAEGIQIIETILNKMANSKLNYEDQWNGFSLLFRVLASLYFARNEYDIAIQISKYVKRNIIKRREGANIHEVLDELADNLEHKGEQYSYEYKKLYCYTYYVADFYKNEFVASYAKKYYEQKFEPNMKWY